MDFESVLYRQWGEACDLLDYVINMCRNIGIMMYNKDWEEMKTYTGNLRLSGILLSLREIAYKAPRGRV